MVDDDDKSDLGRFGDRNKTRDEFSTGPTENQIRQAEKMLGSFKARTYLEKRDLSDDYHAGALQPADKSANPVKVLVSAHPIPGQDYHIVLSDEKLPAMRAVDITIRRLGELHTMTGFFEPGHTGRRSEDKHNGTLMVSYFFAVE